MEEWTDEDYISLAKDQMSDEIEDLNDESLVLLGIYIYSNIVMKIEKSFNNKNIVDKK
jgi:hypothetical protein